MVVGVDTAEDGRSRALSLVREGRLYDLGRVLDERAPVFPGRYFRQMLVPEPGADRRPLNWVADVVSTTTQVGTHLDALCHLSEDGRIHGGHAVADVAGPSGFSGTGSRPCRSSSRAAGSSTSRGSAPAT